MPNHMRCLVIDDEPLARKGIELNIAEVPFLKHLQSFGSAVQASAYLAENEVDLIFLDIEMPQLNGLAFLRNQNKSFLTILTTAYPQYALEAFELEVVDYLVKPVRFERFFKAVQRAKNLLELEKGGRHLIEKMDKEFCYIKSERRIIKVFLNDIWYIKGLKDYVILEF